MSFDLATNVIELWHVQLAGGVVRTMTLDELDSAFQAGMIDERTLVLRSGALQWSTLGDVAGIQDQPNHTAQSNSIAPMATDIAASSVAMIPSHGLPNFDVAFGTEELAVFRPKRRVGRAFFAVALVAMLGGGLFALKSYGTAGLRAKVASVTSFVSGKSTEGARAAAVAPPPAMNLPPAVNAPPMANATPVPIDWRLTPTPADKNGKKKTGDTKKPPKPTKAGAKGADPTQKGTGQYDPLNGNL